MPSSLNRISALALGTFIIVSPACTQMPDPSRVELENNSLEQMQKGSIISRR